jgi:hypothetical protein
VFIAPVKLDEPALLIVTDPHSQKQVGSQVHRSTGAREQPPATGFGLTRQDFEDSGSCRYGDVYGELGHRQCVGQESRRWFPESGSRTLQAQGSLAHRSDGVDPRARSCPETPDAAFDAQQESVSGKGGQNPATAAGG